ncbi:MAG: translesion error-prone DNA polymerase V autoproteolytic subunit [Magnetococcales bacterium]|nr:translesion error-prone DNA polymerase V autoproteolytic subunit [Magnetococcales bacterium]
MIGRFIEGVPAGFPSPADDFVEGRLDISRHLIRNPSATFFVRVEGCSMSGMGVQNGDILVVDRSIDPADGMVVVAALEGSLAVKIVRRAGDTVWLESAHKDYPPIRIAREDALTIWGVVTNAIHALYPIAT